MITASNKNKPLESIKWGEEDKEIIISAYMVWNEIENDYPIDSRNLLLDQVKQAFPKLRTSNINEKDKLISAQFFKCKIEPSRLHDCKKSYHDKITLSTEEAWKAIVQLFSEGHTFGEREITIDIPANENLSKIFIQMGADHGVQYYQQLQTDNSLGSESEDGISDDSLESKPSQDSKQSATTKIRPRCEPLEKVKARRLDFGPDIINSSTKKVPIKLVTPTKVKLKRLDFEPDIIKSFPKKVPIKLVTPSPKSQPLIEIKSPESQTLIENKEIIDLIKTRLKICQNVSEIDWKWAALGKDENIESIRGIWERHLYNLYGWRDESNPLMVFVESSTGISGQDPIDWKWVAEGLKSTLSQPTPEECQETWQQTVYDKLKNTI